MENNKVPVNPFCERRKMYIQRTYDMIKALTEGDGKIKYNKLKAVVIRNLGVSDKLAREYIKLHLDEEMIVIRETYVYLNKKTPQ